MTLSERLAALPPPLSIAGARRTLREALLRGAARVVAIDDDPTGTQTVHGVRVLMRWTRDALGPALSSDEPVFYLSTNSRSLPASEAGGLAAEVGRNLRAAGAREGIRVLAASRSDSTLRGHFPAEVDALVAELPGPIDGVLLVPALFEAGRCTIDNVHWVDLGSRLVPAHETEFAGDPDFGYHHGDLREWIEEKTLGRIRADTVACISLEDIRRGGPERVAGILDRQRGGAPVVVNAACDQDLEVVALGAEAVEQAGRKLVYRTGASFVKVRAGIEDRPLLTRAEIAPARPAGLVVAGSYVARTTAQIDCLRGSGRVHAVEVSPADLLAPDRRPAEIRRAAEQASRSIQGGRTALVYTSRERRDSADFLSAGRGIMTGLCDIVRGIDARPGFVVAKGGITSIAVATEALQCAEALVMGQILRGVPVWKLGGGCVWSDTPYVVFPGNVGDSSSLRAAVEILEGERQ